MPLDIPGRPRATLSAAKSLLRFPLVGKLDLATVFMLGKAVAIVRLEKGNPSRRRSPTCIVYVPALCTHHLLLLPIERFSEALSAESCFAVRFGIVGRT